MLQKHTYDAPIAVDDDATDLSATKRITGGSGGITFEQRYCAVAPACTVSGSAMVPVARQMLTDRLKITGTYAKLSLCIYGNVVADEDLPTTLVRALQQQKSEEKEEGKERKRRKLGGVGGGVDDDDYDDAREPWDVNDSEKCAARVERELGRHHDHNHDHDATNSRLDMVLHRERVSKYGEVVKKALEILEGEPSKIYNILRYNTENHTREILYANTSFYRRWWCRWVAFKASTEGLDAFTRGASGKCKCKCKCKSSANNNCF